MGSCDALKGFFNMEFSHTVFANLLVYSKGTQLSVNRQPTIYDPVDKSAATPLLIKRTD